MPKDTRFRNRKTIAASFSRSLKTLINKGFLVQIKVFKQSSARKLVLTEKGIKLARQIDRDLKRGMAEFRAFQEFLLP